MARTIAGWVNFTNEDANGRAETCSVPVVGNPQSMLANARANQIEFANFDCFAGANRAVRIAIKTTQILDITSSPRAQVYPRA